MNKDLAYVKLMLEDISTIADKVTSGNVSHNIATIKCNARKALECLDSMQEKLISEDLEEAADNALSSVLNTHEIVNIRSCLKMFRLGVKWKQEKDSIPAKDLEEVISYLSKRYPEVSFAKLSRIAVYVAKWQQEKEYTCYEEAFEDGAKWKVENLWKPADGDDLPEIDREVVAILDNGKVVFAHRPPEFWDGKDIVTGKVTRNYPKTYDKGGWNIPDVKYWLDCQIPNMGEG